MDLQTYIQNAVKASRAGTLAASDQLTLGELILKTEAILQNFKNSDRKEEPTVCYDFGYMRPTKIDSWRGSYSELALNYTEDQSAISISEFLKILKDAIGATFEGYKGGEFIMHKHTPVWVANCGNSGNTAVIDIIDDDYQAVIITGYREY